MGKIIDRVRQRNRERSARQQREMHLNSTLRHTESLASARQLGCIIYTRSDPETPAWWEFWRRA